MKRETRSLVAALCSLVFVAVLITPAGYPADEVTIRGIVFSSECLIGTPDGQEYAIAIDEMGVDLMTEDGKRVEVRGVVEEKEGKKIINVEKYTVVK